VNKQEAVVYRAKIAAHSGVVSDRNGKTLREFHNTDERAQPAAFAWGEQGPGAFALAHSILTDRLGFPPSRQVAMDFAFKVIATLDPSSNFELDSDIVDSFVDSQGGPNACRDEWEDAWIEAPETLTIETELVSIRDVIDRAEGSGEAPSIAEPVSASPDVVAALTGGVIASKGSEITALAGSIVRLNKGAIVLLGDRKYVVKGNALEEL